MLPAGPEGVALSRDHAEDPPVPAHDRTHYRAEQPIAGHVQDPVVDRGVGFGDGRLVPTRQHGVGLGQGPAQIPHGDPAPGALGGQTGSLHLERQADVVELFHIGQVQFGRSGDR